VVLLPAAAAAGTPPGAQRLPEELPTREGRITVTLPDGTVLTLIGVPRLLIPVCDWIGTGNPQPA
jgi:hypothetical protein